MPVVRFYLFKSIIILKHEMSYHINHNNSDVLLRTGTNKSLNRPLCEGALNASSTTNLPNNIGFPLSLAIFSRVSKALSVCPLAT